MSDHGSLCGHRNAEGDRCTEPNGHSGVHRTGVWSWTNFDVNAEERETDDEQERHETRKEVLRKQAQKHLQAITGPNQNQHTEVVRLRGAVAFLLGAIANGSIEAG